MIKKIILLIALVSFSSSCDYTPIHSGEESNIKINITNLLGDTEINNYLSKELKRKSKNSGEKIEVKINSHFSKKVLARDTKSFATDYELKVVGKFELIKGDKTKSFIINEKFRYKNLNDNYEDMIKKNLMKTVVNKLILRINNFK